MLVRDDHTYLLIMLFGLKLTPDRFALFSDSGMFYDIAAYLRNLGVIVNNDGECLSLHQIVTAV